MEKYDINKVYTQYKEFIASYIDLKALASKIIEQRQLSPVMNDTKWLELQTAILSIPEFEPAYNIQLLTDNITYSQYLNKYQHIWEVGNLYMKTMNIVCHHSLRLNGLLFSLYMPFAEGG